MDNCPLCKQKAIYNKNVNLCVCDSCGYAKDIKNPIEPQPDKCATDAELINRSGCKGCEDAIVKNGRVCCDDPNEYVNMDGEPVCRKREGAIPLEIHAGNNKCATCRHDYEPKE